ncbi:MAG: hypothetical protein ACWA41_09245 [Putridiphycobacter sp.]
MIANDKNKIGFVISAMALLVFVLSAFFSNGYYHADEHFQIIEFAYSKKMGLPDHFLAWEFESQIRPTFQPTLAYCFLEFFGFIGIENPYIQITILKIISAVFAFLVIGYFVRVTRKIVTDDSKINYGIYKILSYFIWVVPVVSLRFSSETWSGITLLLAVAFFQDKIINKGLTAAKWFFYSGVLFTISFLFRFQIVFFIFPFFVWMIINYKENIKGILYFLLGGMIILGVGTIIDSWFYGSFVFTPYKYFYVNIIEGKASTFGEEPWDFYFKKVWQIQIIGAISVLSFVWFAIKKRNSFYFWGILFFAVGHSFVAHKEFRFIFPMVFFVPFVIMFGFNSVYSLVQSKFKKVFYSLITLFIGLNLFPIYVNILKGEDDNGRHNISKYLYDHYQNKNILLISTSFSSPYSPFELTASFYAQLNLHEITVPSICDLDVKAIEQTADEVFFVTRKSYLTRDSNCSGNIQSQGFEFVETSISDFPAKMINQFIDKEYESKVIHLYRLKR